MDYHGPAPGILALVLTLERLPCDVRAAACNSWCSETARLVVQLHWENVKISGADGTRLCAQKSAHDNDDLGCSIDAPARCGGGGTHSRLRSPRLADAGDGYLRCKFIIGTLSARWTEPTSRSSHIRTNVRPMWGNICAGALVRTCVQHAHLSYLAGKYLRLSSGVRMFSVTAHRIRCANVAVDVQTPP